MTDVDQAGTTDRRLRIELWLAVVFMAVAFAGGFFVRGLSTTQEATNLPDTYRYQAPPLSEDQLQGGVLPAGHPSIPASTTPKPAATASAK